MTQGPPGYILTPQQIIAMQRQRFEQLRYNAHEAMRLTSGHFTGLLAYTRVRKYETATTLAPAPTRRQRLQLLRRG